MLFISLCALSYDEDFNLFLAGADVTWLLYLMVTQNMFRAHEKMGLI